MERPSVNVLLRVEVFLAAFPFGLQNVQRKHTLDKLHQAYKMILRTQFDGITQFRVKIESVRHMVT